MYKLLKKPFFGKYMVQWRNPLTEAAQKDWEPFTVKSKSGGILQALFAKSFMEVAKATIVLAHPMGKEAKGYFLKNGYTDLLRSKGYNVVIFDINGFGESTHGNFNYFDDIVAISIAAKKRTPALPIGFHGISLGGQYGTLAFADNNHQFDFAIVESAATSLDEFWVIFPLASKALKLLGAFLPKYKQKIHMEKRIHEIKKLQSILYIYSHADTWIPIEMGYRFLQNTLIPSSLYAVYNASHAQIMKSPDQEAYKKEIIDYFNSCTSNFMVED